MSELEMTGLELLEAVGSKLTDKQIVALVLALAEVSRAKEAAMKAAEAIGPVPLKDDFDGVVEWAGAYADWYRAVWKLPKAEQEAKLAEVPDHELSCGDPGHDYTDHIVEYEGEAILDTQLPEGGEREALSPAPVGPKWTPRNGRTSTSTSNGDTRRLGTRPWTVGERLSRFKLV